MPCRDYESDDRHWHELYDKINHLTDMLCRMCKAGENTGMSMPADVRAWWEAHQIADTIRKENERVAQEKQKAKDLREAKRLLKKWGG